MLEFVFYSSCCSSLTYQKFFSQILFFVLWQCCDHPYLVDDNLQGSLTRDLPVTDYLDIGVNASGKLQVLDKILQMVKDQGLRVMILFQVCDI